MLTIVYTMGSIEFSLSGRWLRNSIRNFLNSIMSREGMEGHLRNEGTEVEANTGEDTE